MPQSIVRKAWLATILSFWTLTGCGPNDSEVALQTERDALRSQLQAVQQGLAAARQEANANREQVQQLDIRVATLNGDNLRLTQRFVDAQTRLAETTRQLADIQARAERLSTAVEAKQPHKQGQQVEVSKRPAWSDESAEHAKSRPQVEVPILDGSQGRYVMTPISHDGEGGRPRDTTDTQDQLHPRETTESLLALTHERNILRERLGEIGTYARKKDDEISRLNERLYALEQRLTHNEARLQTLTLAHKGNRALLRDLHQRLALAEQERDLAMEVARACTRYTRERTDMTSNIMD